ncbi:LysM peptidoglycan-binding domain-containing protein [Anaerosolibacter sp.]|uniref:LysM peptidoglycan-binding domain-containing protein n=1 Tax=Anaerosolibacter sp. TaxID=1872527 RepID=UPI0039EEAAB1
MHRRSRHIKKYFICAIAILLLLSSISIAYTNYTTEDKKFLEFVEWEVISGDTVWKIAKMYRPDGMQMWEYIFEIEKANGIKAGDIIVGQRLRIPIFK